MNIIDRFRLLTPAGKAQLISGFVFFLVYFGLGLVFILVRNLPFAMSPPLRIGFGAVLIAYAAFRFARIAKSLRTAGGSNSNGTQKN